MTITYKNEYGTVHLTLVEDYRSVKTIKRSEIKDRSVFLTMDECEKIALITENRGIQLCPSVNVDDEGFVVHHKTSSLAAIAKAEIDFISEVNPRKEIQDQAKIYSYIPYGY